MDWSDWQYFEPEEEAYFSIPMSRRIYIYMYMGREELGGIK
jgi:hypothetical protein